MDIEVKGLKELEDRLIELGAVAGMKAMRSAMFTASKPTLDQAKATAPVRSGALRESITRTFSAASKTGSKEGSRFSVRIGPKVKNRTAIALYNLVYRLKRPRRGIFYGHFLEFGTNAGTKATHWLRNALQATAARSAQLLAETLKKRIEAAVKKR